MRLVAGTRDRRSGSRGRARLRRCEARRTPVYAAYGGRDAAVIYFHQSDSFADGLCMQDWDAALDQRGLLGLEAARDVPAVAAAGRDSELGGTHVMRSWTGR